MSYPGATLVDNQSFRVLQLLPGIGDEPIHFSLELATFSEDQPRTTYDALSYAWGDLTLAHKIFYENPATQNNVPFTVTTNCHNALKHLRLPEQPRTLWIDAICINQHDLEERSAQIRLMRAIYSEARQVIVYLGESADDSDSVMRYLQDSHSPIEYPRREIIAAPSEEAWQCFLSRPWFTRTWVLQEVKHAQSVEIRCGDMDVSWEALATNEHVSRGRVLHGPSALVAVYGIVRFVRKGGTLRDLEADPRMLLRTGKLWDGPDGVKYSRKLLEVLKMTRRCLASDPRDKVYGILPLLQSTGEVGPILPDYRLSTVQVFINVALYLFQERGMEVLREASAVPHGEAGSNEPLPSWTPDWTRPGAPKVGSKTNLRKPNAGGEPADTPRRVANVYQGHIIPLLVTGIRIGSLASISDECDVENNIFPLTKWRTMALESGGWIANLERSFSKAKRKAHEDAFHQLLTFDDIVYKQAIQMGIELITDWEKNKPSEITLKESFESLPPSYQQQVQDILDSCNQRKLVVLDNGMIGLVPTYTAIDDVVYVLPGASVPFVFRQRGAHYILIGECYVQGIMYGEARTGVEVSSMEQLVIE